MASRSVAGDQPRAAGLAGRRVRILIVGADRQGRKTLRHKLSRCGIPAVVTEADSGADALERLDTELPECILVDRAASDMDGLEVVWQIRLRGAVHANPVILLTAHGDEALAVEAMRKGAYDCIARRRLRHTKLRFSIEGALRWTELNGQLRAAHERMQRLSMYDSLTGLPNRNLFFDRLEQAMLSANRGGRPFALLMMDLDLFKEVNDGFGHEAGDNLLVTVAQRLQLTARRSDTVARLGGDEFVAILTGVGSGEDAVLAAEKIIAAVREPVPLDTSLVTVGVSIGIALFPEHGRDGKTLLAHADQAMYDAKRGSRGFEIYSEDSMPLPRSVVIAGELSRAIEEKQLFVVFQPKTHLGTREVIGAEALVRWHRPDLGVIPPAQFVPAAERSAVIGPLTYAVVDMALDQALRWKQAGLAMPVAVNLSPRLLDDGQLTPRILHALGMRGLDPQVLTLELTETALMSAPDRAKAVIRELTAAGIHISIDDFGAGFTSLRYLRELDIDEIKIDNLFVTHVRREGRDASIVRSLAELARGFGVGLVAEGIESNACRDTLLSLGCDRGQGYSIGMPMPAAAFDDWLGYWKDPQRARRGAFEGSSSATPAYS